MLYRKPLHTALGAGLFAALCAVPAHAIPVVEWDYNISAVFSSATPTGPGAGFSVGADEISWGDPGGTVAPGGGRSALSIDDTPAIGSVFTDGGPELANSFTHSNNVISLAFPQLSTATIDVMIDLVAVDPALGATAPLGMMFVINFLETDNGGVGGVCVDGSAVGANGPGCRDIFAITLGDLDFDFAFEDENYTLSFSETLGALGPLGAGACGAVGLAANCIGFLTQEEAHTTAQFEFVINRVEVPAPSAVGLLGLGLLGLAFSRRRAQG